MKTILLVLFSFLSWQFTSCSNQKEVSSKDEEFRVFMKSFGQDKKFQISRIQFPLPYMSYDIEDNLDKITISKNEWQFENFSKDSIAHSKETNKYKINIQTEAKLSVYVRKGIDNGIYIEYIFEKISNKWHLVKIIDKST